MSSGKKANKTGISLESFVERALVTSDYKKIIKNKVNTIHEASSLIGRFYITQAPADLTIYNTKRTSDFFVINNDIFSDGLIIECKWQQVAGSVDEKYPFLFENIKKTGVPTIILLDGGGYKPGAKEWLMSKVKEPDNPLLHVWNMQEFQIRVNNNFFEEGL